MLLLEKLPCSPQCTSSADCPNHTFCLLPHSPESSKIPTTNLHFCPKDPKLPSSNIFPEWNNDALHFTPCFTLGIDRVLDILQKHYNEQNRSYECEIFQRRVQAACSSIYEVEFPIPAHHHKFCGVCKIAYEDYFDHINSKEHMENFGKPKVNMDIEELCGGYKQEQGKIVKKRRGGKEWMVIKGDKGKGEKGKAWGKEKGEEGSTLATRKLNREQNECQKDKQEKEKAIRHKKIAKQKSSPHKMRLRSKKEY